MATISIPTVPTPVPIFGENSILFGKSSLFQTLGINESEESKKILTLVIYKRVLNAIGENTGKRFNAPLNAIDENKKKRVSVPLKARAFDAHLGGRICQVPAVITASIFNTIAKPALPDKSKEHKPDALQDLETRVKKLKDRLSSIIRARDPVDLKAFDVTLDNWAIYLIHLIFINSCHSVKICNKDGVVRKLAYCFDDLTHSGKYPINKKVIEKTLIIAKEWAYSLSITVVTEMLERTPAIRDKEKESLSKLLNVSLKTKTKVERPFFALTRTVFRTTNHPILLKVRTHLSDEFPYQGAFTWNGSKYSRADSINDGPTIVVEAYGKFIEAEIDNSPEKKHSGENRVEEIIQSFGGLVEFIEAQAAAHDQLSDLEGVATQYNLDSTPKKLSLADLASIPALKDTTDCIDSMLLTLEKKCENPDPNKSFHDLTIEHVYFMLSSK